MFFFNIIDSQYFYKQFFVVSHIFAIFFVIAVISCIFATLFEILMISCIFARFFHEIWRRQI